VLSLAVRLSGVQIQQAPTFSSLTDESMPAGADRHGVRG
jgi:hypothetical protein